MNAIESEVMAALTVAQLEARKLTCISTIRSPEVGRSLWRVELSDRTVKARCLEDAAGAKSLFELRQEMPPAFSRALFQAGRVVVEEWIEGEVLRQATPAQLREAGALLAELHGRSRISGRPLLRMEDVANHRVVAENSVRQLTGDCISEDEAHRLVQALRRWDPGRAVFGLVHFDYRGENMVVDRHGRVRVVDNERVHIDALEFDLARSWYRWAPSHGGWNVFHQAYREHAPSAETPQTRRFWRIVATARAAVLRLRMCPDRVHQPLSALRALATEGAA